MGKDNGYRFSMQSESTLLSTDFAVMCRFLMGQNLEADQESHGLIDAILRHKEADGRFIDNTFDISIERRHKPDYTINQFTFFTLTSLDHLGVRFNKLPFMEELLPVGKISCWLESLNWATFWYESNKIMFVMFFCAYLIEYGEGSLPERAQDCIDEIFKALDKRQDRETGFWGTDLNNRDLLDGACGAAHIYLFYDYFDREIKYPEKIIDSTICQHAGNGLMINREGGACEDYDAVEIYLRLMRQTEYRKTDINEVLSRMKKTIERGQMSDGGFPYKIAEKKFGLFREKKSQMYEYSSWERMRTDMYKSDSWGTFFRVLTLAAIDVVAGTDSPSCRGYRLPGWGYLGKI